jgi:hypothetical protein
MTKQYGRNDKNSNFDTVPKPESRNQNWMLCQRLPHITYRILPVFAIAKEQVFA